MSQRLRDQWHDGAELSLSDYASLVPWLERLLGSSEARVVASEARCAALARALEPLLTLIIDDMDAATARDLACDGPVGNEEGEVWRKILEAALQAREALAAAPTREEECGSLFPGGHGETRTCVLPKGHDGGHEYAAPTREEGQTLASTCPECNGPVLFSASCQSCGVAIPVATMNAKQSS